MAIPILKASIIGRGSGRSAVAAAAYRSRSMILDERTGEMKDYRRVPGAVVFEAIYAPKDAPEWATDRARLWNEVERKETRKNSRVARDFIIPLPHELTEEQNRWLLRDYVRETFVRKGFVADVAIHSPHEHGDDRNIHAHVMVTTRQVDDKGGWKEGNKDREQNKTETLEYWRESWGEKVNKELKKHGHEARIDMRSREDQGRIDQPMQHLGPVAAQLERRGIQTETGNHNRAVEAENAIRRQIAGEPDLSKRVDLAAQRAMDELGAAGSLHLLQEDTLAPPKQRQEPPPLALVEGAVERSRREENEERKSGRLNGTLGEIAQALRALGRTMGQTLANVFTQRQSERSWVREWLNDARGDALLAQGIAVPDLFRGLIERTPEEDTRGRAWMAQRGGFEALKPTLQESACRSYAAWSEDAPELARRFDLESYVKYVQRQEAARQWEQGIAASSANTQPRRLSLSEQADAARREAVDALRREREWRRGGKDGPEIGTSRDGPSGR